MTDRNPASAPPEIPCSCDKGRIFGRIFSGNHSTVWWPCARCAGTGDRGKNPDFSDGWNAALAAQPPTVDEIVLSDDGSNIPAQDHLTPPQPGNAESEDLAVYWHRIAVERWNAANHAQAELDAAQSALAEKTADCKWATTKFAEFQSALAASQKRVAVLDKVSKGRRELYESAEAELAASQAEVARLRELANEYAYEWAREDVTRLRSPTGAREDQKVAEQLVYRLLNNTAGHAHMVALATDVLAAARAQGERDGMEKAAAAICFGCARGWEIGEVHGIGEGYPYPIHKDPQTGNYGHPCSAAAIRVLAAAAPQEPPDDGGRE